MDLHNGEDHIIGKKHKKNVKKPKAKAKAKAMQPREEAAGEAPEAEEVRTTPAAMEDANQQYGYPGGWPPPQYGYPGGWAPPPYGYPGWPPPPMGWGPGYGYPVPHPPHTSHEIDPQAYQ